MNSINYNFPNSFFLLIITCIVLSCNKDNYDFTYDIIIGTTPVNLEEINSSFDDYNSALPYPGWREGIYFSTNRTSGGDNFDFIYRAMDISYHERDDALNITHVSLTNTNDVYEKRMLEINSEFDEFGPYPYWGQTDYEYFFYANDSDGNFDIKYLYTKKGESLNYSYGNYTTLNTEFDDLYPTITDENDLYFCSNRENNKFDIYSTTLSEDEIHPIRTEVDNFPIELNTILSSDKNDKCPYVFEDLMVFTSDREGGFGGYDLYYSKKLNGEWSAPINMGEEINSPLDEYRPIIVPFYEFPETMLVFSSNRTGGKGGFDLYSVRTML